MRRHPGHGWPGSIAMDGERLISIMPKYTYQGRDANGQLVKGLAQGETNQAVAEQLLSRNIIPLKIEEFKQKSSLSSQFSAMLVPQVSSEELVIFCRQMYSLTKAGVPVAAAVLRLSEVISHPTLKSALRGIQTQLASGESFSIAIKRYPKIFSHMLAGLIEAGEANGRLDVAFLQAAKQYELGASTRRGIKTAMRYPFMVIIAVIIAVTVMNFFVVPKFAQLYDSFHAQLPLPTRILIWSSYFMRTYSVYLALGLLAFLALSIYILRKKKVRLFIDRYKLKLPIFGNILERMVMVNFSRGLATLLQTGVPLIQALNLVSEVVDNTYASECILRMIHMIERGESLSVAAKSVHFFSPLVLQMLAVGDETGNTDKMLFEVAEFYEEEVSFRIKQLTAKLEPLLLAAVAGVVLILALGVFLPMWNMANVVK